MMESNIKEILKKQQEFFATGTTLQVSFRLEALDILEEAILKYQDDIQEALRKDLGKSAFESYMCETGLTLSEIRYMKRHLRSFSREKRVRTPLAQFPSRSFQKPVPYGTVLIMSPWNYPFLLSMEPMVDALAAGNTVILKPSAYSPSVSAVMEKMIQEFFPPKYVAMIPGGRKENIYLLRQRFDYIFFTGSKSVGKQVMKQAAEFLTPVTLELGGKSPCLVAADADIPLAARRIVFGKFLNCGQTCVAPDYILCDPSIKDVLIEELKKEISRQFTEDPLTNADYGHIINEKHFQRLMALLDPSKAVFGGEACQETLQITPALLDGVTLEDPVMQEEIFGPILPVLTYKSLEDAIKTIQSLPNPLALYVFTNSKKTARMVTSRCGFGGGCINDTIVHLATSGMGFGGFGESGMGSYHGKAGFYTFTHVKSMVHKRNWLDLPIRYQPYKAPHEKFLHWFLR